MTTVRIRLISKDCRGDEAAGKKTLIEKWIEYCGGGAGEGGATTGCCCAGYSQLADYSGALLDWITELEPQPNLAQ